jgi:hypothetical protein
MSRVASSRHLTNPARSPFGDRSTKPNGSVEPTTTNRDAGKKVLTSAIEAVENLAGEPPVGSSDNFPWCSSHVATVEKTTNGKPLQKQRRPREALMERRISADRLSVIRFEIATARLRTGSRSTTCRSMGFGSACATRKVLVEGAWSEDVFESKQSAAAIIGTIRWQRHWPPCRSSFFVGRHSRCWRLTSADGPNN